jgi:8-oxo-dGTP diphosphatase
MVTLEEAKFFQSAFSVDNVIFGFDEGDLKVLLIKRGAEPFNHHFALPGYFVPPDLDMDTAAIKILEDLTGLKKVYLEQVKTFGAVNRHPFGRVITISYFSLIKKSAYKVTPASFAQKAEWYTITEARGLTLAFDHNEILNACILALQLRVRTRPVGFELLPPKFTLTQLQHLYEAILERPFDKRNFRKKILSMHFIQDIKESQEGVAHRPAKLFEFDKEKYETFLSAGFSFEL